MTYDDDDKKNCVVVKIMQMVMWLYLTFAIASVQNEQKEMTRLTDSTHIRNS